MSAASRYTKYVFEGQSGRIVDSRATKLPNDFLGIGHTDFVAPWSDPCVHLHQESEEFYLLRHGEMHLYIAGETVDLKPDELLMIHPQVPHAVVGGSGKIEYFGIRSPFVDDKQNLRDIASQDFIPSFSATREIRADWGYRIPLGAPENLNRWLIGFGEAKYPSRHLILANLNFPEFESANAGIGTRLRMHYHRESWEYYVALRGRKVLQIEEDLVHVDPGEILEVPPGVRHNIHRCEAPYEGFTIRVPILRESDKVEDAE